MKLIILVGIPGSGKTMLAHHYTDNICEADAFPGLYHQGKLQSSLLSKAHQWCQNQVESHMKANEPLIFQSNTNLRVDSILPYMRLASRYHYKAHIVLPRYDFLHFQHEWSRSQQMDHLLQSRSSGEKIIPTSVIHQMMDRFERIQSILSHIDTADPDELYELLRKYS